jgi:tape measure domain-containing protein
MANDITLGIKIRLDGQDVDGEIRVLIDDLNRLSNATRNQGESARNASGGNQQLRNSLRGSGAEARNAGQSFNRLARDTLDLNGAFRGLMAGLSAFALFETAKSLVSTADSMKLLEGRIQVATSGAKDFAASYQELVNISLRTHTAFDANATLFARVNKAMETLGGTSQDTLALTETMAQAIRISGASAGETASVVRQLSQALASGVLRGDEFNSIMENGSRLAYALAAGLNVNVGELRKMAEGGELSAGRVIQAIMSQAQTIDAEYKKIPVTVGAALQDVRTQFDQYIHTVDSGSSATSDLAGAFEALALNMRPVLDSVVSLGEITAAVLGVQMVGALSQYVAAKASAIAIERAHAAAIAMDLEITVQQTSAKLAQAQANQTAAAAALAATEAQIAQTQAAIAASVTISRHIALTEQLNVLMAQQTAQTTALGGAQAALASAQEAAAAAAAAQSAANTTLLGTLRALLTPMSLLNAGLAIFVGWQFADILNQFEWVRKRADEASISISRLIERASYAWEASKLLFSGNFGDIDRLRDTHNEVMLALDEEIESNEIRKKSMAQVAQMEKWLAESGAEAARQTVKAIDAKTDAQKKAEKAAEKAAKTEAHRRGEIEKTLQQIQQETALIGLSDKERQRAVELTQALTKAKGAEVDTIKAALEHKWAELDADQRRNEMWDELVKQANALDKLHDDAAEAKRLARLAQELKLQGLSNEAIKDRIDLEKELASAREANPDLDPKQVEDYVKQRADAEKTLSDIIDAGSKKSADFMEAAFKRAAENIQDALANMFESLLNGDATRSFDDFIDNIRRSTTKVFAQEMSTSIQSWLSSAFTSGSNGSGGAAGGFFSGMFDWIKNLWGGSTTPGISSNPAFAGPPTQGAIGNGTGMFSSLFSMGQGGGFSMTSAGGGGWGWGALASLANLIPGAGKVSWKGNQQNKTLQSVIGMENMVTDMVGNFFPLFKLIAPLKNMIMNFGAKLFPDRKPSLMGHMLGQAFGPIGDLLGTFLMGSKIPQPTSWTKGVFSNGKMTLGKSEAFEGGEVQITRDFTRDFGVMLGGVGRLLNHAFGDFRAQFWHQIDKTGGEQVAGGLGDRGGNFWLRQLSTGTLKDLASEAALAVAKRNIASQDDLHYRQAIRDSKGLVGLQNRVNQIDQIGVAIGEYGEALAQLKQINLAFDEMATKAAKYRFAEADIEAARQRAIDALKNDTITAFRQLAGLGPTLAAQLGALNDQIIALEANARSLKLAESELAGLRVKAIAQAREQYLAPLTDATASIADQIASITGVLPTPEATAPLFELLKASTDPTEQRRYIDRIQSALTQRYNSEIAQINKVGQAVNNLKAFVDGLKLSDLSTLDPESRLREAQGQYGTTLLKAQAGDQTALANLANTAQSYLQEAKSFYASSPAYADIFSNVTDTLSGLGETLGGTIDADTAAADAATALADSLTSLNDVIRQIIASQGAAFDQQAGGLATGAQGPAKTFQDLTEDQMAANIAALPANATKAEKAAVKAENKSLQSQINAWLAGGDEELAKTQAYQELTQSIADAQAQLKGLKKSDPQYAPLNAELSGLIAQRKALGKVKFKEQGGWTDGLTIVGENGPELINFARPTQVQSNRQTQSIIAGGNDKLIAELQKANAELAALVRLQVKANQELLDRLDKIASASSAMERKTRLSGAA